MCSEKVILASIIVVSVYYKFFPELLHVSNFFQECELGRVLASRHSNSSLCHASVTFQIPYLSQSAPGFEQGKTLAPEPSELGPTDTQGHPAAVLDHGNRSNRAPGSSGLAGFWPGAGVGAWPGGVASVRAREPVLAGGPCYRRVLCLTLGHLLEWRGEQWHCTSLLLLPASLQS